MAISLKVCILPEHRVGKHHGGGEQDEGEVRRGHAGLVQEHALLSLWEIAPEVRVEVGEDEEDDGDKGEEHHAAWERLEGGSD